MVVKQTLSEIATELCRRFSFRFSSYDANICNATVPLGTETSTLVNLVPLFHLRQITTVSNNNGSTGRAESDRVLNQPIVDGRHLSLSTGPGACFYSAGPN